MFPVTEGHKLYKCMETCILMVKHLLVVWRLDNVVKWNTYKEVEDGHVDNVEEPVARVIWIQLFDGVAVERIHFPPLKPTDHRLKKIEQLERIYEEYSSYDMRKQNNVNIFFFKIVIDRVHIGTILHVLSNAWQWEDIRKCNSSGVFMSWGLTLLVQWKCTSVSRG